MISAKFRSELIIARSRGLRQYEIARKAKVHPTVLSAFVHDAIPVRRDDARVVAVGRVLGLEPAECFEREDERELSGSAASSNSR